MLKGGTPSKAKVAKTEPGQRDPSKSKGKAKDNTEAWIEFCKSKRQELLDKGFTNGESIKKELQRLWSEKTSKKKDKAKNQAKDDEEIVMPLKLSEEEAAANGMVLVRKKGSTAFVYKYEEKNVSKKKSKDSPSKASSSKASKAASPSKVLPASKFKQPIQNFRNTVGENAAQYFGQDREILKMCLGAMGEPLNGNKATMLSRYTLKLAPFEDYEDNAASKLVLQNHLRKWLKKNENDDKQSEGESEEEEEVGDDDAESDDEDSKESDEEDEEEDEEEEEEDSDDSNESDDE